jgi:hypothetical protein
MTYFTPTDVGAPNTLARVQNIESNFQAIADGFALVEDDIVDIYVTAGGTANALTATVTPAPVSYVDGYYVAFKAIATNTSRTVTLNVNGVGAVVIEDAAGGQINIGDLVAGSINAVRYNSTHASWQLISIGATAAIQATAAAASASAASASAAAAAASAAGVNLPSVTAADKGKKLFVNTAGSGYELRNPTVLTTNTTVLNGDVVVADSSGGAFTVTLPASPATGAQVEIFRQGANTVTVGRNSSTIETVASDWDIPRDKLAVIFVYDGTTWRRYHSERNPVVDKGSVGTGTVTFNYANGKNQKLTVTGNLTIALTGGVAGEFDQMVIELVNGGSATITWPTVTWMVGDGSSSASFASLGITLATSGTNFIGFKWNGTTNFGRAV